VAFDLNTESGQKSALEAQKHIFRIQREAREAIDREPRTPPPTLIGHTLEELLRHKFPARRILLSRGDHALLRAGNIAQVFAYRGVGKTWFLETWALIAAYGIDSLGIHAPEPSRVLYVDGEMASEDVQGRFHLLAQRLNVPRQLGLLAKPQLTVVGADWQEQYLPRLDTIAGQAAIEEFIEPCDLIFLDNRSCLFDSEGEKDPTAWQPAQDWLLSLRKRGKATVMAHHANRQGGARGIGKAEDVIDLNLKLSRPENYKASEGARFLVEFDKARGVHGPAAASFVAALGDKGWEVENVGEDDNADAAKKIRECLRTAARLEELPKSANAIFAAVKGNRKTVLAEVANMIERGEIAKENGALRLVEVPGGEL
jgi:hypothetical protein